MLSPWIFGFLIFTLGPMIVSLALSFTRYDVINPPEFIGLKNWALLFSDPLLLKSLQNTFFFAALHVPFAIAIALALALLLDQISRGAGFFRTVFYLPSITPAVATGILWLWLLNPQVGIVNQFLHLLHIPGPGWTTDPNWIKPGIVLMSLWGLGNTVVIYFAALRQVPNELYEAARVDGAKPWAQFFRITVPMISGTLFYTLVINTIFALQYFTEVYTMFFRGQESGVSEDALFYVIYLFRQSFEYFHMGYASAMAWLLFAIIVVVTLVQVGFSRKFVYYEGAS
ncbi:MAG: spermidine/putrescine ABC transporter permease [Candidatus Dormiibacter spiritus]|nr:MAG: spermidine/putrescine ABC transporter permease [Candidatus Dormibacteraeota bacterium]